MTDEEIILSADDTWVPCRLCEDVFRRKRETRRWCKHCHQGFCEGEHGNYSYGYGICVVCGAKPGYRTRQQTDRSLSG